MILPVLGAPLAPPVLEPQDTNYWRLLRNLPEDEKKYINSTHISVARLDSFFANLDLEQTPHTTGSLQKLSLYSLVAFREKRITFEETVSHHLFVSTVTELFLTADISDQSVEKIYYSSKKDNIIALAFDLNVQEHEVFEQMMRQTPVESEKYGYLINVPKDYPLEFYRVVSSHITILNMHDGTFFIPSFTMLKTLFSQLSHKYGPYVTLVPTFGELRGDEVESMKAVRQTPLGLYCPEMTMFNRMLYVNSRYMVQTDGYDNVGPFQFWVHDMYHALREMSQKDEYAYARSRLASLFKVDPTNTLKRNYVRLVDGEINSTSEPCKLKFFPRLKFSDFLEPYTKVNDGTPWRYFAGITMVKDIVDNPREWRDNFGVRVKDLSKKQKDDYRYLRQRRRLELVSKIGKKNLSRRK